MSALVPFEHLVLGCFAVHRLRYRRKRAFLRDRWIDIALLVPFVLPVHVGAWLAGMVLAGRALRATELVDGLEASPSTN